MIQYGSTDQFVSHSVVNRAYVRPYALCVLDLSGGCTKKVSVSANAIAHIRLRTLVPFVEKVRTQREPNTRRKQVLHVPVQKRQPYLQSALVYINIRSSCSIPPFMNKAMRPNLLAVVVALLLLPPPYACETAAELRANNAKAKNADGTSARKLQLLRQLAESSYSTGNGGEVHGDGAEQLSDGGESQGNHGRRGAERREFRDYGGQSAHGVGSKSSGASLDLQSRHSTSSSAVSVVRSQLSQFGTYWRKHAMAEAAAALRQASKALSELALYRQKNQQRASDDDSDPVGSACAAIADTCNEYAGYMLFAGMEDGSHTDWPRLVSALFSTLWAIAELSDRWVVVTDQANAGLSAWMRPGDLRTFAKAVVSVADRGSALQPQTVLLARYAICHTFFLDGKLDKAASAIETAVMAIADDTDNKGLAESSLVLTSLHVLYAHVLLAQGHREAAVDRCVVLASSDMDFNIVYRCVLPRLPLPVPQADRPAFTLDEIDTLLSRVAADTPHGGSSVTNLHLADIGQWKSFGARSDSLLRLPQDGFADARISARLQCDVRSSAVKSAQTLQPHDVKLLIVVPAVAQEGARLLENLREWARDRQFPCSSETNTKQQTDLMLLFSRTPAETPSWLQSGFKGGIDQALAELVGEAAHTCFGRTTVRFANLTAAQEHYQGAWVATGPNNLFYPLLVEDDELHDGRYDYIFWMETDAFPVQRGWLDRLREESTSPRGFWRKGPTQRPLLPPDMLGMVGPHHYHMNAVGWYRVGDPCYREFLRRVREDHREEPFDVSQHRYLHDRARFNIFQEWAHKFVYTDVLQNWIGGWKLSEVLSTSPNTVIVHGKERL